MLTPYQSEAYSWSASPCTIRVRATTSRGNSSNMGAERPGDVIGAGRR